MSIRAALPWLQALRPTFALMSVCLGCSPSPEPKWLAPSPAPSLGEEIASEPVAGSHTARASDRAVLQYGEGAQPKPYGAQQGYETISEKWLAPFSPFSDTLIATQTASPADPQSCNADNDCGFDPETKQCGPHPSFNHQPPLKDQGIICYCEQKRCAQLGIQPIPCEGDFDCGILLEPRPHPVFFKSSAPNALHHTACSEGIRYTATCERTNICTLNRIPCPKGNRP